MSDISPIRSPVSAVYDLSGQVVLVTGALGGLGPAVVRAFALAGATVVGVIRSMRDDASDALQRDLGDAWQHVTFRQADVLVETEVEHLIREVIEREGHLDVVCNLVGGFAAGTPTTDTHLDIWQQMLDVNLRSTFLVSKHAARAMKARHWGRIINVSSRAARSGRRNAVAYAVAKGAVLTLTEVQAEEVRADGVTVNAVLPSIIDTPPNRSAMPQAHHATWPTPEAIARAMLFLASDDAALISGASIPVYGQA